MTRPLRVLQVPFTWYPDPVGGTEVYVAGLCHGLRAQGIDAQVAAPLGAGGMAPDDGIPVHRFALEAAPTRAQLWARVDKLATAAFEALLDRLAPQIVHLHAHTPAVGTGLVAAARRRGMRTLLTYHTPTLSCARGSLLRHGRTPCDGVLRPALCTQCSLRGQGLPAILAAPLSWLPDRLSSATEQWPRPLSTVLGARARIVAFQRSCTTMLEAVDRVIAVCDWVASLLLRLGLPPARLERSRQGLRDDFPVLTAAPAPARPRLLLLGRAHAFKGADLVVGALRRLPALALDLHLYLVDQEAGGNAYLRALRRRAGEDARIHFHVNQPSDHVLAQLSGASALLVPSRWLETGPLTVLEAFAAGIPVLATRLGGMAELVRDGVDGWLVDGLTEEQWMPLLTRVVQHPEALAQLRAGVRPPRRNAEVVADHVQFYARLLGAAS